MVSLQARFSMLRSLAAIVRPYRAEPPRVVGPWGYIEITLSSFQALMPVGALFQIIQPARAEDHREYELRHWLK